MAYVPSSLPLAAGQRTKAAPPPPPQSGLKHRASSAGGGPPGVNAAPPLSPFPALQGQPDLGPAPWLKVRGKASLIHRASLLRLSLITLFPVPFALRMCEKYFN